MFKHKYALQLQQFKLDKDGNEQLINVDKPTWVNHLREELTRAVVSLLETEVTDSTPKDESGNALIFTPYFLKREWCPEQKKVFIVPADAATYEWFTKIFVPSLKVLNWHFKAVPLSQSVGTVVLWIQVPTADLTSFRRPAEQVWPLICRHNQFNPAMCTFKSASKDGKKKDVTNINFRATAEMVAFIAAGDAKIFRPKYHCYFGMNSYPVHYKAKLLHDKVKTPDDAKKLSYEQRGESVSQI